MIRNQRSSSGQSLLNLLQHHRRPASAAAATLMLVPPGSQPRFVALSQMRSYSLFAKFVLNRSRVCSSIQPPHHTSPSFQRRLAEPGRPPLLEAYKTSLRHMSTSSPSSSQSPPRDTQQDPEIAIVDPDMIALRYVRDVQQSCICSLIAHL